MINRKVKVFLYKLKKEGREMQDFKESNYFSIVVPFHNPKEEADADTFIF